MGPEAAPWGEQSHARPKWDTTSVEWHRRLILNKITVMAKKQRTWDGKVHRAVRFGNDRYINGTTKEAELSLGST
jgi:hypothetical protein